MQYYYVRRCLYEKKGEFISPLTIMTVFLRLFLCYISCLFLIHLKKKWQLCTEVYGNEEEFNKQSSKAHLWILFFNYVSEVNRSQSVVYSSGKQSMCLKNFAWSQLQHAESLSTVSANVLLKLYFFSKCQLIWKDVFGCFWRSSLSSTLLCSHHCLNKCTILVSTLQLLLHSESQTMAAMCFCSPQLPVNVSPKWGFCIAPYVAVWASLCNHQAL